MNILLIEDEAKLARGLAHILIAEGYSVNTANDGEDGFRKALVGSYDLLIVDWMLPKKDGVSIVRTLRETGCSSRILFLTAKDGIIDRVTGLDAGADDYLVKPFASDELLARVRALLRRASLPEGVAESFLERGPIRVNTSGHEVSLFGKQVSLTYKEYELLLLFMHHPRQVLTKEQILDRIWGYDSSAAANAVEIYVHYLRKKLGSAGRLIKTIRGVGYRFEVG